MFRAHVNAIVNVAGPAFIGERKMIPYGGIGLGYAF